MTYEVYDIIDGELIKTAAGLDEPTLQTHIRLVYCGEITTSPHAKNIRGCDTNENLMIVPTADEDDFLASMAE